MKKLLLFIVILFGIITMKGLAARCSAQICMCPGGGYVTTGQYCPVYNNGACDKKSVNKKYDSVANFIKK